jgi:hypothetical protein
MVSRPNGMTAAILRSTASFAGPTSAAGNRGFVFALEHHQSRVRASIWMAGDLGPAGPGRGVRLGGKMRLRRSGREGDGTDICWKTR